jgi:hypothetical protein
MQTARDSQGSIKSPNTVLEDHMEWIDVAGCLAFRAYSLPRIAKFGVGVVLASRAVYPMDQGRMPFAAVILPRWP